MTRTLEDTPQGYDLAEVRRSALNREIRRRRTSANTMKRRSVAPTSSSSEASRTQRSALHQELLGTIRPIGRRLPRSGEVRSASNSPSMPRHERLGQRSLQTIHDEKQSIAELRPARRKIKWNATISDWDRKQDQTSTSTTRIANLQLGDLQIHGLQRNQQTHTGDGAAPPPVLLAFQKVPGMQDLVKNPGAHIDELELSIRRCFQSLSRVNEETTKINEKCHTLDVENEQLRQQLLSMNSPHRRQSIQQSQQQIQTNLQRLQDKVAELDEQLGMLKMQKKTVDADCLILQEIVNEAALASPCTTVTTAASLSSAGSFQHDPCSMAEDSDIKTLVTTDFDPGEGGWFTLLDTSPWDLHEMGSGGLGTESTRSEQPRFSRHSRSVSSPLGRHMHSVAPAASPAAA